MTADKEVTKMEILHNRTIVHLDWIDRFRAFCGKPIHVEVEIHTANPEVTVVKTESRCWADRILPRKQRGGYAEIATPKGEK